jgi:replicative DNA helicase
MNIEDGVPQDILIANFQKLLASEAKLAWEPSERRIFEFLSGYFRQCTQLPSAVTIKEYFEERKDGDSVERVKDLEDKIPVKQTDYQFLLREEIQRQTRAEAVGLLREAITIIDKPQGVEIEGRKKQGIRDGLLHIIEHSHDLLQEEHTAKIQGNIREDGQEVWNEYVEAKHNKANVWGKFCGINNIDTVTHGIKPGELWIHAGFAGQLKTSFALNMSYNLVTRYRSSVAYVTLEMPYKQVRKMIIVMHSSHGKFTKGTGFKGTVYKPLNYERVCSGDLTPEEEAFYKIVLDDFQTCPEYGRFDVWSPDENVTIDRINMWAQVQYQKQDFHLLVIDHGGLVEANKKKRNREYTIEINSVVRDAKMLALHFNHGQGIPVLLLFQLNREGLEYADKNGGRFKLRALSYSNESERSADIITTTYLNEEHRRNGTTIFDCLKRRDGKMFEPFECRRSRGNAAKRSRLARSFCV